MDKAKATGAELVSNFKAAKSEDKVKMIALTMFVLVVLSSIVLGIVSWITLRVRKQKDKCKVEKIPEACGLPSGMVMAWIVLALLGVVSFLVVFGPMHEQGGLARAL